MDVTHILKNSLLGVGLYTSFGGIILSIVAFCLKPDAPGGLVWWALLLVHVAPDLLDVGEHFRGRHSPPTHIFNIIASGWGGGGVEEVIFFCVKPNKREIGS